MANAYMGIPNLALSAVAVTKSNSTVLAATKALYVGTQGDVAVIMAEDSTSVVFVGAVGFLPIMVKQVLETGTDAADILALY